MKDAPKMRLHSGVASLAATNAMRTSCARARARGISIIRMHTRCGPPAGDIGRARAEPRARAICMATGAPRLAGSGRRLAPPSVTLRGSWRLIKPTLLKGHRPPFYNSIKGGGGGVAFRGDRSVKRVPGASCGGQWPLASRPPRHHLDKWSGFADRNLRTGRSALRVTNCPAVAPAPQVIDDRSFVDAQ